MKKLITGAWTRAEQTLHLKLEVLGHYCPNGDPCCACCGEDWPIFLGIDHMNGQGAKHREEVGRGAVLHRWLKNSGYPEGYQVLCFNCNFAKHRKGTCPHRSTPNSQAVPLTRGNNTLDAINNELPAA